MSNEYNIPKSNYLDNKSEIESTKSRFVKIFEEYKSLLKEKIHPDNQTEVYKKRIQVTIQRLLDSASKLDQETSGEGIFGLIILCLSSILKLKDDNIKLEHEIKQLKIEINKLKKQKGV